MDNRMITRFAVLFSKGHPIPLFKSRAINRKINRRAAILMSQRTEKKYTRKGRHLAT